MKAFDAVNHVFIASSNCFSHMKNRKLTKSKMKNAISLSAVSIKEVAAITRMQHSH